MNFVKLLKRSHWVLIVAFLLLLAIQFFHTQHFLARATNTSAMVTSVVPQSVYKAVTLRYVTQNQTVLESTIPVIATSVKNGDQLPVRYNQIIPVQVRLESFIETWFPCLLCVALSLAALISLLTQNLIANWWKKRSKNKLRNADHIYTQFKDVEEEVKAKENGKKSYRIISTWFDPKTKQQYEFKSQPLSKNPHDYIMDQTIKVMVNVKSKKKYLMDLSFLPGNLLRK